MHEQHLTFAGSQAAASAQYSGYWYRGRVSGFCLGCPHPWQRLRALQRGRGRHASRQGLRCAPGLTRERHGAQGPRADLIICIVISSFTPSCCGREGMCGMLRGEQGGGLTPKSWQSQQSRWRTTHCAPRWCTARCESLTPECLQPLIDVSPAGTTAGDAEIMPEMCTAVCIAVLEYSL